jgi:hypothetical protein
MGFTGNAWPAILANASCVKRFAETAGLLLTGTTFL